MGDDEFKELYARLSTLVFSYAARVLSPEQAKDVVSETFMAVWRKREECPADPADWTRWIIGIGKNQVLQELQRVKRKHHDNRFVDERGLDVLRLASPDSAESVVDSAQARWVWHQLKPKERELVNLVFVRGLSDADVAGVLDVTVTAVTTRASRVRQKIAALLEASDGSAADTPRPRGAS